MGSMWLPDRFNPCQGATCNVRLKWINDRTDFTSGTIPDSMVY